MGDYSDPYVNCKVGKTTHRTPTINDNLNPEWPHDKPFTFPIGKKDKQLDIEVMNECNVLRGDNSLGTTSISLKTIRPMEWQHIREKLKNGGDGEVEFGVYLEPAQPPPGAHPGGGGVTTSTQQPYDSIPAQSAGSFYGQPPYASSHHAHQTASASGCGGQPGQPPAGSHAAQPTVNAYPGQSMHGSSWPPAGSYEQGPSAMGSSYHGQPTGSARPA